MSQIIKNLDSILTVLENNTGKKFGSIRKMGEFKSFTYMIILFEIRDIEIYFYKGKNLMSELLFTDR